MQLTGPLYVSVYYDLYVFCRAGFEPMTIRNYLLRNGPLSGELPTFLLGHFLDVHDGVLGQLLGAHQAVERRLEEGRRVDLCH